MTVAIQVSSEIVESANRLRLSVPSLTEASETPCLAGTKKIASKLAESGHLNRKDLVSLLPVP